MKKYEINVLKNKYDVLVTLLSFRSPFEFIAGIEDELKRICKAGTVVLDEYTHNNSEDKRFISFKFIDGRIDEGSIRFEKPCSIKEIVTKSNQILIKNRNELDEIGVSIKPLIASKPVIIKRYY
jgi:hypothetical protein